MHGIQNLAGRSPVHQLGVDGTITGFLRLQRSQRIILSTLGGEAHGEEKVLQLIGSSMVGMKTHGVIMMRGRVVDGVLLLLQVLTAARLRMALFVLVASQLKYHHTNLASKVAARLQRESLVPVLQLVN